MNTIKPTCKLTYCETEAIVTYELQGVIGEDY